jgi:hypothetical protein
MNQWIWILSIFLVGFILILYIRRPSGAEGFGDFKDSKSFADKQFNFFHKLLNRGAFLNNGVNLAGLNAAINDNNLYNTIPENKDYTPYFSPDPYKEYFDYDATFCKPARHPRNLPARERVKATQCGWWYVPDPSVPSVGAVGTRQEPLVRDNLPGNGQWVWDLDKAAEMEDFKMCKRIKSCDLMDLEGIQGNCGFCERRGYAVPILRNGAEKYPESGDACGEKIIQSSDKCYKPPVPELVTDDGIQCGNYGYPSIDGSRRLYTPAECAALGGNYLPSGECLNKSGRSYSAECAGLNVPAPDAPRAVCDPDSKGTLSRECLISLAKGMGYNQSGGILRMLISRTGPNQLDKYALELLQTNGMTIPDAVLGSGAIDKESAGKAYSDLYNSMTAGYSKLTRQAAQWLVSGTDSFDICDFEPAKTGPFPMTCLQREFRQAGCQPAGAAHPSQYNATSLQGLSWAGVTKKFKDLYASMKSTNPEIQAKATKDCLGINFYKHPDVLCPKLPPNIALRGGRANKYCADEGGRVICNRDWLGPWEKFKVVDLGNNKIALMGGRDGKYCADEGGRVICNRDWLGPWEVYEFENLGNNKLVLKGGRGNQLCADDSYSMACNRGARGPWEVYTWEKV